jgi:hypothetical protein
VQVADESDALEGQVLDIAAEASEQERERIHA